MTRLQIMFADREEHWLVIDEGAIVRRGTGFGSMEAIGETIRVFVTTAMHATVQRLSLPDLTPVQAAAAARLQLAEQTLLTTDDFHLACGQAGDDGYMVVTVSRALISQIVEEHDPDIIMPSPLLLPQPETGFLKAELPGEMVFRSRDIGFCDDPAITPLIIGDAPITLIDGSNLEAALVAAVADPLVNLRSGEFARRVQWRFDHRWRRQMLSGLGILLLLSLAIPLTEIFRLSSASQTLEQTSASLAQAALGEAVAPERAVEALDARLRSLRGGGGGFRKTAEATLRALESTTNVEVTAMSFGQDGTLRLSLRAAAAAELETVQGRMRAAGLEVRPGALNPSQGQPTINVQVRGR